VRAKYGISMCILIYPVLEVPGNRKNCLKRPRHKIPKPELKMSVKRKQGTCYKNNGIVNVCV